jgi:hypothetical protein
MNDEIVKEPRKPAGVLQMRATKSAAENTLPPLPPTRNMPRPKPQQTERDLVCKDAFRNSPAAYQLRQRAGMVYQLWKKDGYTMRELSLKFQVKAKKIEQIIREVAA